MLLHLVLLAFIPCLISATLICPDGKVSCPQNQRCCFESGQYRCCDPVEDEEALKPGSSSMAITNMSSLEGIQNAGSGYDYCPNRSGRQICCVSINCYAWSECCSNNINCCISGYRCCGGGLWCCKRKEVCGPYYNTCRSAGVAVVPAVVATVLLVLAAMQSKSYFL